MVKALNGSGKTGCFVIPALQFVDLTKKTLQEVQVKKGPGNKPSDHIDIDGKKMKYFPQCVIVADTGMLVDQIADECEKLIDDNIKDKFRVSRLMGEVMLDNFGQILVTTPVLLSNLVFAHKKIGLENVKFLAVDEAEGVWNGFKAPLIKVLEKLRTHVDVKIMCLSATLDQAFKDEFKKVMQVNPIFIDLAQNMSLEGISQFWMQLSESQKAIDIVAKTIVEIRSKHKIDTQILIFVNEKQQAKKFEEQLKTHEILKEFLDTLKLTFISAELKKQQQREVLEAFRQQNYKIMLSTNILARGIDIRTVCLVINLGSPRKSLNEDGEIDATVYKHRVARTGRFLDKGVSLTLFNPEKKNLTFQDNYLITKVKEQEGEDIKANELKDDQESLTRLVTAVREAIENNSREDNIRKEELSQEVGEMKI